MVEVRFDSATPADRADLLIQLQSCLEFSQFVHGPDVVRLLRLTTRSGDGGVTRRVLAELAPTRQPSYAGGLLELTGLSSAAVGEAVADAVLAFSVDALAPSLTDAVTASISRGGAVGVDVLLACLAATTPSAVPRLLTAAAGAVTALLRTAAAAKWYHGGDYRDALTAAVRVLYGSSAADAPAGSAGAVAVSDSRTAALRAVRALPDDLGVTAVETAVTVAAAAGPGTALAGVPAFGALLRTAVEAAFSGRHYGDRGCTDVEMRLAQVVTATGVGVKAFAAAVSEADRQRGSGVALGLPPRRRCWRRCWQTRPSERQAVAVTPASHSCAPSPRRACGPSAGTALPLPAQVGNARHIAAVCSQKPPGGNSIFPLHRRDDPADRLYRAASRSQGGR